MFGKFKFSPLVTIVTLVLAAAMIRASFWQWSRYHEKLELVETYAAHSSAAPLSLPIEGTTEADFAELMYRKVKLSGRYDFKRQVIVTNRKHASGPGHWILTPLRLEGSDHAVIVSRGFIPFADGTPQDWERYSSPQEETLLGVVQPAVTQKSVFSPPSAAPGEKGAFVHRWLYPDIAAIAEQLPYPVVKAIFVQRIGGPVSGTFPAESISIQVPPSTHFGYTIEWVLLAVFTLAVGFSVQAFPQLREIFTKGRSSRFSSRSF